MFIWGFGDNDFDKVLYRRKYVILFVNICMYDLLNLIGWFIKLNKIDKM